MRIKPHLIFGRDSWTCYLCAGEFMDGDLVPHHRANRGSGGFHAANTPENILSLCSICNGQIEADHRWANEARRRGIKISKYDTALAGVIPVLSPKDSWIVLDSNYGSQPATEEQLKRLEGM
jgi:hypothetical protein